MTKRSHYLCLFLDVCFVKCNCVKKVHVSAHSVSVHPEAPRLRPRESAANAKVSEAFDVTKSTIAERKQFPCPVETLHGMMLNCCLQQKLTEHHLLCKSETGALIHPSPSNLEAAQILTGRMMILQQTNEHQLVVVLNRLNTLNKKI